MRPKRRYRPRPRRALTLGQCGSDDKPAKNGQASGKTCPERHGAKMAIAGRTGCGGNHNGSQPDHRGGRQRFHLVLRIARWRRGNRGGMVRCTQARPALRSFPAFAATAARMPGGRTAATLMLFGNRHRILATRMPGLRFHSALLNSGLSLSWRTAPTIAGHDGQRFRGNQHGGQPNEQLRGKIIVNTHDPTKLPTYRPSTQWNCIVFAGGVKK